MKPKVITLCGSTRFRRAFEEWNVRLTVDEGAVVLSIVIPSHSYGLTLSEREKTAFDAAHLAKIDLCDEIFMLDIGGYIGDSARRELDYGAEKGKKIRYLSQEHPSWTEADCRFSPEISLRA